MEDILTRICENLVERLSGPMHFRFVLQPFMAVIFAIRDGRRDAREGRVPYFWSLFSDPGHRRDRLKNGWRSEGRVFIFALILDVVYQYMESRWVYPAEALLVASILAMIPYILLRGPANRLTAKEGKEENHE
jgi:hypothetical protein